MQMLAVAFLFIAAASAASLPVVPLADGTSSSTVVHNNGAGGSYSYTTVQKSLGGLNYPQPVVGVNQAQVKTVTPVAQSVFIPQGHVSPVGQTVVYQPAAIPVQPAGVPIQPGLVYNGLGGVSGVVPVQYPIGSTYYSINKQ
ncbi:uncharacterized protein [Anabrus simplex]|uniref:uncharacterized protein n=1 Tax=Anabrus simplex TaxID=316456 RepID=UPI0035A2CF30